MPKLFGQFLSISLGICLPAACSVENLGAAVNNVLLTRAKNSTAKVFIEDCQDVEKYSDIRAIDFVAM